MFPKFVHGNQTQQTMYRLHFKKAVFDLLKLDISDLPASY